MLKAMLLKRKMTVIVFISLKSDLLIYDVQMIFPVVLAVKRNDQCLRMKHTIKLILTDSLRRCISVTRYWFTLLTGIYWWQKSAKCLLGGEKTQCSTFPYRYITCSSMALLILVLLFWAPLLGLMFWSIRFAHLFYIRPLGNFFPIVFTCHSHEDSQIDKPMFGGASSPVGSSSITR